MGDVIPAPGGAVAAAVRRVAEGPRLEDLDPASLAKVEALVTVQGLAADLGRRAEVARVDYAAERAAFLAEAGARSRHSARAYAAALDRLDSWAARLGVETLALTPAQADDWIRAMAADGASPATVALRAAGASALFSYLGRRHAAVGNPFRGTRARPKARQARGLAVPSPEDVATILAATPYPDIPAVRIMTTLGLRVGALPGLTVRGARWSTTTKGKALSGAWPESLSDLPAAPCAGLTATVIADRFRVLTARLHAEGRIAARYSVHDLRHAHAVALYRATRDVYAVSRALGHAGVAVTERYLRSLGERE